MPPTRKQLQAAASDFCQAFADKRDLDHILSLFSVTYATSIIEYGDPILAPFLGKEYKGIKGITSYFGILETTISYHNVKFSEYIIDAEGIRVAVKGNGTFTWLSTEQSWDEAFAYMLDFDDELKVVKCQIWADSGSAYLARKGNLREVKESESAS